MPISFDEALAFALTLPGVAIAPHYGTPAAKVRGKAFVMRSREPGSFGVAATLDEVELLRETEPAAFWQSPHYVGWGVILVREDEADAERVRTIVERAWSARASKAQRLNLTPNPAI